MLKATFNCVEVKLYRVGDRSFIDFDYFYNCVFVQDENPSVAESAVVGYPHDIKGEGSYRFNCGLF